MRPKQKLNLWPWMKRLTIKNKDAKMEHLDLDSEFAWAQRMFIREVEKQYNEGRPIRIIVLKARQLGISTATEGLLFNWCFLFPGTNALVLSKDRENSETIFEMAKLMWDQWPLRALFSTTRASARRLSWAETLSNFRVSTAKGTQVGRGSTIHAVHGSEVAFWENADELMPPLNEAVPMSPGTIIILESTANGVGGFFYDTWMAAERGESDYVPMFFPWHKHGEYRIKRHNLVTRMLTPREGPDGALRPRPRPTGLETAQDPHQQLDRGEVRRGVPDQPRGRLPLDGTQRLPARRPGRLLLPTRTSR